MVIIEKIIMDYLKKELNVPCYLEEKPIVQYVLITKISSSRKNYIDRAMFSIKSYDSSKYKASVLNEKVKQAMDNMIKLDIVSSSKLNSDYESTDIERKKYRYTALYDVVFYL